MTHYLSADDLVYLNTVVGGPGAHGADMPGLDSAAARPRQTVFGDDRWPTLWLKAAALLHAVASHQYFLDGSKRTAWTAMDIFLTKNGYRLPPIQEIYAETFVQAVAQDVFKVPENPDQTVEKAAEWLQTTAENQAHAMYIDPRLEFAQIADAARTNDDGSVNALSLGMGRCR